MLDGSPTIYPKKDGDNVSVIAEVNGTIITQNFTGTNGDLVVTWKFGENSMAVTKQITIGFLDKKMEMTVAYGR